MNKLIVDEDSAIVINNNVIELDIRVKELTIEAEGKVLINNIVTNENDNLKLTINVKPNSEVIINRFLLINKINEKIVINQEYKSTISFNESIIALDESKLDIESNLKGSNNNCNINVKVVTKDNGRIIVDANGKVNKNIIENNLLENIRVLMLNDEENIIVPNLLVNSNEVTVNHNATMGSVDREALFYLNSKGIDEESANKLICKGFLINNLEIDKTTQEKIENLF